MAVDIDFESIWTDAFLEEVEARKEKSDYSPDEWRAGGRVSKAWPNKEDSTWWLSNGPAMLQQWADWWERSKGEGWTVWTTPTGVPAIELPVMAVIGSVPLRGYIDAILVDPDGDLCLMDWKGLATFTPIPTTTGWKTMGELEVGDEVFGRDGHPCKVTGKSKVKQIPCYRVRFDDGTSIVCDQEHLWHTVAGYKADRPGVRDIEEIRRTLRNPVTGGRQHRIPNAAPLSLPAADLPIDPYTLGVWLGDGTTAGGHYTSPDPEIADLIRDRGYEVRLWNGGKPTARSYNVVGLRTQLRETGLLGHKAVPDAYLRGSVEQRLDLLRGMMDTDGTWNRCRNQAEFFSTDKALAQAVYELAASLGDRPYLNAVSKKGFGLVVTCYEVKWRPNHYNPFNLPRKADLVQFGTSGKGSRRMITAVEVVPSVPTQCIAVDSEDNTYLCGEQMVPTHNTSAREPEAPVQLGAYRVAVQKTLNVEVNLGTYYLARKGDMGHVYDLSIYTEKLVGPWLQRAKAMQDQGLFIPKPSSLCSACGVRDWCSVMSTNPAKLAEVADF